MNRDTKRPGLKKRNAKRHKGVSAKLKTAAEALRRREGKSVTDSLAENCLDGEVQSAKLLYAIARGEEDAGDESGPCASAELDHGRCLAEITHFGYLPLFDDGFSGKSGANDMGTTAPEGGGFEVRRRDNCFMPGVDADLVLRSSQPTMTILRSSPWDRFYTRMFDGSNPPNYSEFSAALIFNLPFAL